MPLMPEPIVHQDGTNKNDCERTAAKRLIAKLRQDHPQLPLMVPEASLSSNGPHIEMVQDHALHYILGVTEGDHAFLCQQVAAAEQAGQVPSDDRHAQATGIPHHLRDVSDVPRKASNAALRGNFIECWEREQDKGPHCSWVTDLRVNKGTASQLMRGGRARWQIDNETFNTLKNQGYNCAPNCGHG